jgi:glycosyltransferase involved in cell wall biosynthesis
MSSMGTVLVLSNLFPQPQHSAAGVRTTFILNQLCKSSENVHFAAASKSIENDTIRELEDSGVHFHSLQPNNSSAMHEFLNMVGEDLTLVIHDKFYTEETYSFHINKLRPQVVQIVDMQDMHSLRRGRQDLFESASNGWDQLQESINFIPNSNHEMLLRELASIHRCDLALVCSPVEHELLTKQFQIKASKLCCASFWVIPDTTRKCWDERNHFCFIGGYHHAPNVDAVKQISHYLWPIIREQLPDAEMHVFGANVNKVIQDLHDPEHGFFIKGFCGDLSSTFVNYRVLLAPLRYGAGIKGKIVEAWKHGLPVVTTPIGSEGMTDCGLTWGGIVASTVQDICDAAVHLHSNEGAWQSAAARAQQLLTTLFNPEHWEQVDLKLKESIEQRTIRRSTDYTRSILWHQKYRSTEYFSRWIEGKNRGP